jgi:hypothetical protein
VPCLVEEASRRVEHNLEEQRILNAERKVKLDDRVRCIWVAV